MVIIVREPQILVYQCVGHNINDPFVIIAVHKETNAWLGPSGSDLVIYVPCIHAHFVDGIQYHLA